MSNENKATIMRGILDKHLQSKISKINMQLLEKILQEEIIKQNNTKIGINKIRLVIKLFIDEQLSEVISRELSQLEE